MTPSAQTPMTLAEAKRRAREFLEQRDNRIADDLAAFVAALPEPADYGELEVRPSPGRQGYWAICNKNGDAELGNWLIAECFWEAEARKIAEALRHIAASRDEWRPIESAPKGYPSLGKPSEWFLARPANGYEGPKGKVPATVIRRVFNRGFGPWECTGDAYYKADFFDAWMPLPDNEPVRGLQVTEDVTFAQGIPDHTYGGRPLPSPPSGRVG